jgi:hypothetical protein
MCFSIIDYDNDKNYKFTRSMLATSLMLWPQHVANTSIFYWLQLIRFVTVLHITSIILLFPESDLYVMCKVLSLCILQHLSIYLTIYPV